VAAAGEGTTLMNELDSLLEKVVELGASDLHLKVGRVPIARVNGELTPLDSPTVGEDALAAMLAGVLPASLRRAPEQVMDRDLAYRPHGLKSRFRVNVFHQKGLPGAVFRQIPSEIPTLDGLGFKPIVKELATAPQGLILVTGPTGSGKSTTLAAMINELNNTVSRHIVTVEDPMEFVHADNLCLINQREVGIDTPSFNEALRRVMRQDPDVILVGEMRDAESISIATKAAETGHLVFSTLHTNDAKQSIDRIINNFPPEEHYQVRMTLAMVLHAVISQRLLPRKDGSGRIAVREIMINTPTIAKLIAEGRVGQIGKMIEESAIHYGMQSLNQALLETWQAELVTEEAALIVSTSPSDLKLKMNTNTFGAGRAGKTAVPAGWEQTPPPVPGQAT